MVNYYKGQSKIIEPCLITLMSSKIDIYRYLDYFITVIRVIYSINKLFFVPVARQHNVAYQKGAFRLICI